MAIRPIDVRRKEFASSFRGYDANQVDDFLDALADEFERAYTENVRLRDEVSSLRERLEQFEELEGSIRAALVHAEQAAESLHRSASQEADDLRRSAVREADLTIREAKARSHQMLAESSARVERIQESYEALQEAKSNFANDFRHLLKSYLDTMENMEISSAREIEASLRERLDTESIAVAREAAAYREESAVESTAETQLIEPEEPTSEAPPEVGESETFISSQEPNAPPSTEEVTVVEERTLVEEPAPAEESSAAEESAAVEEPAVVDESAVAEDADRAEPALGEDSGSQSFSDREAGEASPEEGGRDNLIFRASRFLRRRE
ncbi:MAG: DivIVA domain-containing protein [Actinomycetota bacterium]|jgi:cell division initiation protein|nr:DivIVA domain-containing protein [Actinomycetota bacterium]